MKRKDELISWRKKTPVALRAELKGIRLDSTKKMTRARILTILREKQLATNE